MNDLFDRLEEFKNDYNKVPKKMIIHISWHEEELQIKSKTFSGSGKI